MRSQIGVALPFWLDRPDEEALDIARAAEQCGVDTIWVGEMASFDAFALATAIGLRTERVGLKVGPLAIGVRSPVAVALGISSVATLTGRRVDVALGASSPVIVNAWHDRPWSRLAPRMRETVLALRAILDGDRIDFDGDHVHAHGFRLRRPQPSASITVAAFGEAMTRVAATHGDEVVLNLVTPEHVAEVHGRIESQAAIAGRAAPPLAVWVPAALDPGERALAQLAGQLAVYLGAPGYGELFARLGFEQLVSRARAGTPRSELVGEIPIELLAEVSVLGTAEEIRSRVRAYLDAGAAHVAVAPSTAEDACGHGLLEVLSRGPADRRARGPRLH